MRGEHALHVVLSDRRPIYGILREEDDSSVMQKNRYSILLFFFLFCPPNAIAQTTANQPPSLTVQGATPSSPAAQDLEQEINSEVAEAGDGKASLAEVNKELSNPISTIWALSFQQNTFWLSKPERNLVNLLFQPVLPVSLTDDWNLITRPVIPVFNSTPYVNKNGNLHRVTGFGDIVLVELLSPSPKLAGPWLLGAGPTFIFPTASNSRLGQNKWQIGPTGRIRLSQRKVDRGRVSPAVVVGRWFGLKHHKSDESSILLHVFSGSGLVSRHVPQHAGELVRKEKQQHDHISDRPEHQQGSED